MAEDKIFELALEAGAEELTNDEEAYLVTNCSRSSSTP